MKRFRDLSIRYKLTVLLGASAAIALLISVALSLALAFVTQRSESLRQLQQISNIASDNLTAALAFRDGASAERLLGSLHVTPNILLAIIHDEEGLPFGVYPTGSSKNPMATQFLIQLPHLLKENHARLFAQQKELRAIELHFMYAITPIRFDGKTIGTLTLLSDTQDLKQKLIYYLAMQGAISLATLVIIAFISVRLQRVFTAPIVSIIEVIRTIARTKNYAVTVKAVQNDEFKVLYTHFNGMIAEIQERDARLCRLATTDVLTGLANRRHAMEELQTLVTRAQRKCEFFGLVMFDVDHFKHINDHYGHPVGDIVLKEVAAILSHLAREYDLVARIGGEEFLVLCDNSDQEVSCAIAERMRQGIESAVIAYADGKTLQVTVSAGVYASCPESEDTAAPLSRVDEALYHAKHSGRNRVCIWEPTQHHTT